MPKLKVWQHYPEPADEMREMLRRLGYSLMIRNVVREATAYEHWRKGQRRILLCCTGTGEDETAVAYSHLTETEFKKFSQR